MNRRRYSTLLVFSAALLPVALVLAACDPITLALGVGGGYVASKEISTSREKQAHAQDRRVDREKQYYEEQDRKQATAEEQRLTMQINEALLGGGMTQLMSVHVEAHGGTVSLYGTLPSATVADRAVEAARSVKGVQDVVSHLTIMEMQVIPTGKTWQHSAPPAQHQMPAPMRPVPPMHPDYKQQGQGQTPQPVILHQPSAPLQGQGQAQEQLQQDEEQQAFPLQGEREGARRPVLQDAVPQDALQQGELPSPPPQEGSPIPAGVLPPVVSRPPEPPGTVRRTLPTIENPQEGEMQGGAHTPRGEGR